MLGQVHHDARLDDPSLLRLAFDPPLCPGNSLRFCKWPASRSSRPAFFCASIVTAPRSHNVFRIAGQRDLDHVICLADEPRGQSRRRIRVSHHRESSIAKSRHALSLSGDQDFFRHRSSRAGCRISFAGYPTRRLQLARRLLYANSPQQRRGIRPPGRNASSPLPRPVALSQPLRRRRKHPPRQTISRRHIEQSSLDCTATFHPRQIAFCARMLRSLPLTISWL